MVRYKLRALGCGNMLKRNGEVIGALQFYDYDKDVIPNDMFELILSIFPKDVLVFKTLHGYSFVSLSIQPSWEIVKLRAEHLSFLLGQDYTTGMRELVIRLSSKFKDKDGTKVSHKPYFLGFGNNEVGIVSENHLNLFKGLLPEWVFDFYNNHEKEKFEIHLFHYKTKYKSWWRNII